MKMEQVITDHTLIDNNLNTKPLFRSNSKNRQLKKDPSSNLNYINKLKTNHEELMKNYTTTTTTTTKKPKEKSSSSNFQSNKENNCNNNTNNNHNKYNRHSIDIYNEKETLRENSSQFSSVNNQNSVHSKANKITQNGMNGIVSSKLKSGYSSLANTTTMTTTTPTTTASGISTLTRQIKSKTTPPKSTSYSKLETRSDFTRQRASVYTPSAPPLKLFFENKKRNNQKIELATPFLTSIAIENNLTKKEQSHSTMITTTTTTNTITIPLSTTTTTTAAHTSVQPMTSTPQTTKQPLASMTLSITPISNTPLSLPSTSKSSTSTTSTTPISTSILKSSLVSEPQQLPPSPPSPLSQPSSSSSSSSFTSSPLSLVSDGHSSRSPPLSSFEEKILQGNHSLDAYFNSFHKTKRTYSQSQNYDHPITPKDKHRDHERVEGADINDKKQNQDPALALPPSTAPVVAEAATKPITLTPYTYSFSCPLPDLDLEKKQGQPCSLQNSLKETNQLRCDLENELEETKFQFMIAITQLKIISEQLDILNIKM